ncbi:MAG TPA: cytochrome c [Parafilimonas sp.]|nr:cytochrome c [Parafilimonas sp.]
MRTKIVFALVVMAASFLGFTFQDPDLDESIKRGKEVYTLNCQNCHMENGEGMEAVYPPVAKTDYVQDAQKNIDIVLNGQHGAITVNGKQYDGSMDPMNYLSDKEIADVLNYVRNNWDNKYPMITESQVKEQRDKPANN